MLAFNDVENNANRMIRNEHRKYYLRRVDIKDYNVMIDGRNFYDNPISSQIEKYNELRKVTIFLTKEQSVLTEITTVFARCEIYLQYSVLDYKIDAWFPKYKLAIEIDELGRFDRDSEKEKTRENKIKQKLQCELIRINPDKENFDIYV